MRKPPKGSQRPPRRGVGLWEDVWTSGAGAVPACGWRSARGTAAADGEPPVVENRGNLIGTLARSC